MSKDQIKDHEQDQENAQPTEYHELPAPTGDGSTAETYFFPNNGGITAFSCRADSLKEAQERNQEHLETIKKEHS